MGKLPKNPIKKLEISDAIAVAVVTLRLKFTRQSSTSSAVDTSRQLSPNASYRSAPHNSFALHVPPVDERIVGFTVSV